MSPFKVHSDLPIPGKGISDSVRKLVEAMLDLEVRHCLEVDVQDLNWANREPGFSPKREDVVRRITTAKRRININHFKERRYVTRPISDTSVGVWRLEDRDV